MTRKSNTATDARSAPMADCRDLNSGAAATPEQGLPPTGQSRLKRRRPYNSSFPRLRESKPPSTLAPMADCRDLNSGAAATPEQGLPPTRQSRLKRRRPYKSSFPRRRESKPPSTLAPMADCRDLNSGAAATPEQGLPPTRSATGRCRNRKMSGFGRKCQGYQYP